MGLASKAAQARLERSPNCTLPRTFRLADPLVSYHADRASTALRHNSEPPTSESASCQTFMHLARQTQAGTRSNLAPIRLTPKPARCVLPPLLVSVGRFSHAARVRLFRTFSPRGAGQRLALVFDCNTRWKKHSQEAWAWSLVIQSGTGMDLYCPRRMREHTHRGWTQSVMTAANGVDVYT